MSTVSKNISEFVYVGILLAVFVAVLTGIGLGLTGNAANVISSFTSAVSSNLGLIAVVFLIILAVWVLGYVYELQKTSKTK